MITLWSLYKHFLVKSVLHILVVLSIALNKKNDQLAEYSSVSLSVCLLFPKQYIYIYISTYAWYCSMLNLQKRL